jgi:hypothetical protein
MDSNGAETFAAIPPPDSAGDLLAALRRLIADGKVELAVEPKRLNHIGSPVAVEADGNIWAYGFLALATLAYFLSGVVAAGVCLVLGVAAYLTLGRAYVHRRIERRVRGAALGDLETWRKAWRFAGLTLRRADGTLCASPDGNWMAFVREAG